MGGYSIMGGRCHAPSKSIDVRCLKVGEGFVVKRRTRGDRIMITAAHCLPHLPLAHPASFTEERTYQRLLGPLDVKPMVWAECLFADPVADIAVLGVPDEQYLSSEAVRGVGGKRAPARSGQYARPEPRRSRWSASIMNFRRRPRHSIAKPRLRHFAGSFGLKAISSPCNDSPANPKTAVSQVPPREAMCKPPAIVVCVSARSIAAACWKYHNARSE
jgi:hypothetical protein